MSRRSRLLTFALLVSTPSLAAADAPREFLPEAKELLVAGACADGTSTHVPAPILAAHCKKVKKTQASYQKRWVTAASEFFRVKVPADLPKKVVYPFAGGDLSTALTVYPDADEITTISLEPAGDPRALGRLPADKVRAQLAVAAKELSYLYTVNFSLTIAMQTAMQRSQLPTQLIFSLSALQIHGYEPTSVRYFQLEKDGELRYLTEADLARIDALPTIGKRNGEFANVEIKFKKRGQTREQTFRHLVANLDDKHLAADPRALRHLEKKGKVAAMTKAASYLMAKSFFATIRGYLLEHAQWMVSDTTGVAPRWGKPAGFEYETWGKWEGPNMGLAQDMIEHWRSLYKSQPFRRLKFRFGYGGNKVDAHLVIMRRKA